MSITIRKPLLTVVLLLAFVLVAIAGFAWSGAYNVGADDPHLPATYALMEKMRDRSIATRANDLDVPADLDDAARIRQGAGNYNAMCMGCHLAPGMGETELSQGLYPAPPNLSRETVDAAEAFWVIKHGIKASGMPAWGKSMDDAYVWNMAAFLQVLPTMTPAQYQALVDSSGGHEHGGGETVAHAQGSEDAENHGAGLPEVGQGSQEDQPTSSAMTAHRHADGTVESHPVEPAPVAEYGHDHQH